MRLDPTDRRIVAATQAGLDFTPRPYLAVAERLGLDEAEVIARMSGLLARGVIRRIGAAPNHYALGLSANGMTVWDVEDGEAERLGALVGAPAYLNGFAAVPLVAGLIDQGMSNGAAMSFVIAGGVSCIPAAIAVWALVKPRVFAAYVGLAITGAILAGLAWGAVAG